MAKTEPVNPEGLTFSEWVCAAGVAVFTRDGRLKPYSESSTHHYCQDDVRRNFPVRSAAVLDWASEEAIKRFHARGCRYYWLRGYRVYVVRRTSTHYPKKIRAAWRAGEDPTDWMAMITRGSA